MDDWTVMDNRCISKLKYKNFHVILICNGIKIYINVTEIPGIFQLRESIKCYIQVDKNIISITRRHVSAYSAHLFPMPTYAGFSGPEWDKIPNSCQPEGCNFISQM